MVPFEIICRLHFEWLRHGNVSHHRGEATLFIRYDSVPNLSMDNLNRVILTEVNISFEKSWLFYYRIIKSLQAVVFYRHDPRILMLPDFFIYSLTIGGSALFLGVAIHVLSKGEFKFHSHVTKIGNPFIFWWFVSIYFITGISLIACAFVYYVR
jgi:hypothetical protein